MLAHMRCWVFCGALNSTRRRDRVPALVLICTRRRDNIPSPMHTGIGRRDGFLTPVRTSKVDCSYNIIRFCVGIRLDRGAKEYTYGTL